MLPCLSSIGQLPSAIPPLGGTCPLGDDPDTTAPGQGDLPDSDYATTRFGDTSPPSAASAAVPGETRQRTGGIEGTKPVPEADCPGAPRATGQDREVRMVKSLRLLPVASFGKPGPGSQGLRPSRAQAACSGQRGLLATTLAACICRSSSASLPSDPAPTVGS